MMSTLVWYSHSNVDFRALLLSFGQSPLPVFCDGVMYMLAMVQGWPLYMVLIIWIDVWSDECWKIRVGLRDCLTKVVRFRCSWAGFLRWKYMKGESGPRRDDCVWLVHREDEE